MLARLLGFKLGNRGGLAPKCCVSWTLEGYPCYRGGTVVQFAQIWLVSSIIILDPDDVCM